MWGKIRIGLLGALALVLSATAARTSYSAEVIPRIQIEFTDQYGKGEVLEPIIFTPSDTSYEIKSIKWSKKVKDWEPGKVVTATITLQTTGEDFFMESYQRGKCTVKHADFVSAKCKGSELIVKVHHYPKVILGETERAGWSDNRKSVATWQAVKYANSYELMLYETDEKIRTIKGITTNSKDLSNYIKNESDYYYMVKAVPKDNDEEKYIREGEFVTSEMTTIVDLGDTTGHFQTTNEGVKFLKKDGNYVMNDWHYIWGFWYYFNENGFRATGWNVVNGRWYYMNEKGEMQTGWLDYNGSWYYLAPSGEMMVGWAEAKPGMWYYLYEDGRMAANTTIDGKYWVNGDGLWVQ